MARRFSKKTAAKMPHASKKATMAVQRELCSCFRSASESDLQDWPMAGGPPFSELLSCYLRIPFAVHVSSPWDRSSLCPSRLHRHQKTQSHPGNLVSRGLVRHSHSDDAHRVTILAHCVRKQEAVRERARFHSAALD